MKVERLRELKRDSKKFYKRRQKYMENEGLRFKLELEKKRKDSQDNSEVEEGTDMRDDCIDEVGTKGSGHCMDADKTIAD